MPAQSSEQAAALVRSLQKGVVPTGFNLVDWTPELPLRDHQLTALGFLMLTPRAFIFDDMGTGKALDNSSNVLTPSGWTRIDQLLPNESKIIGTDGLTYDVLGVFPQGKKEVIEVEFSDGTVTRCCEDHLWTFVEWQSRYGKKIEGQDKREYSGVVRHHKTAEITHFESKVYGKSFGAKTSSKGNSRWTLPPLSRIDFPHKELAIEPYALGLLLGDGTFRGERPRFSTGDPELAKAIESSTPGLILKKYGKSKYDYNLAGKETAAIMKKLDQFELMGKYSHEKHIPEEYLWSSWRQRLALLQGLMDTDGSASGSGGSFTSTSKELAEGVVHLVRSLGGIAKITPRVTSYTYKGEKKQGRVSYRVNMSLDLPLFRLARKLVQQTPYSQRYRRLKEIRRTGEFVEMTCISVNSPDRLFIVDGFVPTHNTATALGYLNLLEQRGIIGDYPEKRAIVVTTAPNVRMTWEVDGFEKFVPKMCVANGKLSKQKRFELYNDPSWRVLVTNYESVRQDVGLLEQLDFSVAIFDEADVLKNANALTTEAIRRVTGDCERRVAMTGTPLTDKTLVGMYSLLEVMGIEKDFAGSKSAFENYYHEFEYEEIWLKQWDQQRKKKVAKKRIVKKLKSLRNVNEFREQLRPYYIRRTVKDLPNNIPETKVINKYLEPTKEQERLYKQAKKGFMQLDPSKPGNTAEIDRAWDHLRKICINTGLVGGPDSSAKMDFLQDKLQTAWVEDKVVVFTNFLESARLLGERLKKEKIGYVTIIGSTSEKKREEAIKRFREDPDVKVLIGTRTLVRGLNLQNARIQVSLDLLFNPGEVAQIAGRIARDGSLHDECLVVNLFIYGSLEHAMYKYVSSKQAVSDFVLGEKSNIFKSLTPKEQFAIIKS